MSTSLWKSWFGIHWHASPCITLSTCQGYDHRQDSAGTSRGDGGAVRRDGPRSARLRDNGLCAGIRVDLVYPGEQENLVSKCRDLFAVSWPGDLGLPGKFACPGDAPGSVN